MRVSSSTRCRAREYRRHCRRSVLRGAGDAVPVDQHKSHQKSHLALTRRQGGGRITSPAFLLIPGLPPHFVLVRVMRRHCCPVLLDICRRHRNGVAHWTLLVVMVSSGLAVVGVAAVAPGRS